MNQFHAREQSRWDEQIDQDSQSGKLDFLFNEAAREHQQALVKTWPARGANTRVCSVETHLDAL